MARDRWAEKARNQARINGEEYTGKQVDVDKPINRLMAIAFRDTGIDPTISPAHWVRAQAKKARLRSSGEFLTLSSIDEIKKSKGVYADVLRRIRPDKSSKEELTQHREARNALLFSIFDKLTPVVSHDFGYLTEEQKSKYRFWSGSDRKL